ncbi:hypothetical protein I3842_04G118100, partial [Carya illinoinensis]
FFTTRSNTSIPKIFVGICYKWDRDTVVWVANRDNPLPEDVTGVFRIAEDGNLKVLDSTTGKPYWSTALEISSSTNRSVKLLDSGNLVLSDDHMPTSLWESFKNPTDTFLSGMKMDENLILTSWQADDDPQRGPFTFKLDQQGEDHYVVSKKSLPHWKNQMPGTFSSSNVMPYAIDFLLSNFSKSVRPDNKSGLLKDPTIHLPTNRSSDFTRLVMNNNGQLQYLAWNETKRIWSLTWSKPEDECGIYNYCGKFGSCNINNWPFLCKCLPGFKPTDPVNYWVYGDFSGGCARNLTSTSNKIDTFLRLKMMKVSNAGSNFKVTNKTECEEEYCLKNSQCVAYSYQEARKSTQRGDTTVSDNICWIWSEYIHNLQEEYQHPGRNLSVRVAKADIGNPSKNVMILWKRDFPKSLEEPSTRKIPLPLIVVLTLACVVSALACIIIFMYIRKMAKRQVIREKRKQALHALDSERHVKDLIDSVGSIEEDEQGIEVPFFDLECILAATNNFSDVTRLGQGGYGPVYLGTFPGGKEIAVKRLSTVSRQGLQEFKNEVVLISKLQHRNLVRLRVYCINVDEKILLYEYMPNKSLDSFIFDKNLSMLLDWKIRFNIILGITRGLLYLHQDSRLRIIHRDLKASNILLDEEVNPKISDFGLARIVGGKEIGDNTTRIAGTLGYMSPEYALNGIFLVKSDVYSFGIDFYQSEEAMSLVDYAWRLWEENRVLDSMDQSLLESCNVDQFLKCINITFLCVQEDPSDRPNMSNIITMLDGETVTVPTPRQPAFILRKGLSSTASSSSQAHTRTEWTSTLGETSI